MDQGGMVKIYCLLKPDGLDKPNVEITFKGFNYMEGSNKIT